MFASGTKYRQPAFLKLQVCGLFCEDIIFPVRVFEIANMEESTYVFVLRTKNRKPAFLKTQVCECFCEDIILPVRVFKIANMNESTFASFLCLCYDPV